MAAASSATTSPTSRIGRRLSIDYKLGENDVYVGRSNLYKYHPGNKRFNEIVLANMERYYNATGRREKSAIIYEIVDQIRASSPDGGFVKRSKETGRWYEVGDVVAREKTSQAFRNATVGIYKSSRNVKPTTEPISKVNDGEESYLKTSHSSGRESSNSISVNSLSNTANLQWQEQFEQEVNWYQDRITSPVSNPVPFLDDMDTKPSGYSQLAKGAMQPELDERKLSALEHRIGEFRKSSSFASESSSYTSTTASAIDNTTGQCQTIDYVSPNHPIVTGSDDNTARMRSQIMPIPIAPATSVSEIRPMSDSTSGSHAPSPATQPPNTDAQSDKETFDLLLQLYESWKG